MLIILLVIIQSYDCRVFKIYNSDFIPNGGNILLKSIPEYSNRLVECLSECESSSLCLYTRMNESDCSLYSTINQFTTPMSPNVFIYKKIFENNGLMHYWPIISSSVGEIIGGKNLYDGVNVDFVPDRFGNENSAIRFRDGFIKVPPLFIRDSFTFTSWFRILNLTFNARILEFGNGVDNNNIILVFCHDLNGKPFFSIVNQNEWNNVVISNTVFQIGRWYHIAFGVGGNRTFLYIDSKFDIETIGPGMPKNINRTINYFGGTDWNNAFKAYLEMDEIKIYERSLSESEIQNEYLN
ncbi:unnamed protein product [Brachionus calyciflorus]|uniref:Uncharacterized protein n=1 Tax=Brachionus calyciflorus TaxID=104777 RepID=A0A814IRJ3_9BILA|nr:unnamed protein product [Brachionus calyciflorus]